MQFALSPILRCCFLCLLFVGFSPQVGWSQEGSDVAGVVVDASSGAPIADVILRVRGTVVSAASDAQGRFVLQNVPDGSWTLEVTHIRYGEKTHAIAVQAGVDVTLEIRLAEAAIELEPLVVEGETTIQRERRTTGASFWQVERTEIERAVGTSRHMGDVIRQTVPGLRLRQANNLSTTDICLEFRAAASISIVNQRACNHPMVLLDGVPVADPQYLYGSVPLQDIERIQVIPPGEASTRYGSGSLYGVLLIETRRPGLRNDAGTLAPQPSINTFDWEQDPAGHSVFKAFLGSAVGNALGLAAGVAIGRQCIDKATDAQISTTCSTAGTTASAAAAVALPALGAALGARLGGATDLSQGSLAPALMGAGLMLFPGYGLSMSEAASENPAVDVVGGFFLTVGVPLAVTLADRLYRKLR